VLGLSDPCVSESDVAAGVLRLLETASDTQELELTERVVNSRDELVVGVVEAVQECVLSPPRGCTDLRARAGVEAASWLDDFFADDAESEWDVLTQQMMFLLAELVADAMADALLATRSKRPLIAVDAALEDLRGRACRVVRTSMRLPVKLPPLNWLFRS
jgi:hypothetical protein